MKAIKVVALQLNNGHIILGYDKYNQRYHVSTSFAEVSTYSHQEMIEIYGEVPESMNLLSTKVH